MKGEITILKDFRKYVRARIGKYNERVVFGNWCIRLLRSPVINAVLSRCSKPQSCNQALRCSRGNIVLSAAEIHEILNDESFLSRYTKIPKQIREELLRVLGGTKRSQSRSKDLSATLKIPSPSRLIAENFSDKPQKRVAAGDPDKALGPRIGRLMCAVLALEWASVAELAAQTENKLAKVSINRYCSSLRSAGYLRRVRKGSYYIYSVPEKYQIRVRQVREVLQFLNKIVEAVERLRKPDLEGEFFDD